MATHDIAAAMARTILRAIRSPAWLSIIDDEERAWTLMLSLCDELHPFGPVMIPSRPTVEDLARRIERHETICRDFDGRNYAELARAHGLTTRQVRRIIEAGRRRKREPRPRN